MSCSRARWQAGNRPTKRLTPARVSPFQGYMIMKKVTLKTILLNIVIMVVDCDHLSLFQRKEFVALRFCSFRCHFYTASFVFYVMQQPCEVSLFSSHDPCRAFRGCDWSGEMPDKNHSRTLMGNENPTDTSVSSIYNRINNP